MPLENDLAPNVLSIFPLGWSNKSLPVDLRLYNEFDVGARSFESQSQNAKKPAASSVQLIKRRSGVM